MEFRKQLPVGLFVLTLLPTPVLACTCAPGSMGFCQALPDTSNAQPRGFRRQGNRVYRAQPASA